MGEGLAIGVSANPDSSAREFALRKSVLANMEALSEPREMESGAQKNDSSPRFSEMRPGK
jgi:hypothetical protein